MHGWVWRTNLTPLFEMCSQLVGYRFDDLDAGAVEVGVERTDAEAELWFAYDLVGKPTVSLRVARDPGSDVVLIEIDLLGVDETLAGQFVLVMDVFSQYRVVADV